MSNPVDKGMLKLFYDDAHQFLHTLSEFIEDRAGVAEAITAAEGIQSSATLLCLDSIRDSATTVLEALKVRKKPQAEILELKKCIQSGEKEKLRKRKYTKKKIEVDPALFELFRTEIETQVNFLNEGLLTLEEGKHGAETLEKLMRAAHSIKGAARVVALGPIVSLAHAMEDCFEVLKSNPDLLSDSGIDFLFVSVDFFSNVVHLEEREAVSWIEAREKLIADLIDQIHLIASGEPPTGSRKVIRKAIDEKIGEGEAKKHKLRLPYSTKEPAIPEQKTGDRILRVGTENISKLMGLAGESMVESLWLQPFSDSLLNLKRSHSQLTQTVDYLRDVCERYEVPEVISSILNQLQHKSSECRQSIESRLYELEMFIRRHASLSERLHNEVVAIRMRPFADGVQGFPRFARDLARQLGKKVRLEIIGRGTPVDRDILEKLETPLMHMIRNSIDHGIELPEEREKKGKNPEGTIWLEASHQGGMLAIKITDDGRGIDIEQIREMVRKDKLIGNDVVDNLTDAELFDFLFLPGFSTARELTEISGRGVGLNAVQNMVREVGGVIRTITEKGKKLSFHLQLPLTLSVSRCLLVNIAGEPYAFPLARINKTLMVPSKDVEHIENCQYIHDGNANVGLVPGYQVLDLENTQPNHDILSVVILADRANIYGVVVDEFIGEKELVVHEIDSLIGKVPDILCGAFMEDGSPILIVDVEDMVESIDKLLFRGHLDTLSCDEKHKVDRSTKKILVVDDSITVREVESRLLQNHGYVVQTAVNGMDGWNAVRVGAYDLIITDVDMPRMDGIELVKEIKKDPKLLNLPVMIVSYKDRQEDRKLGLEAGADYYLTKSSFHDETLLEAVRDLIGKP